MSSFGIIILVLSLAPLAVVKDWHKPTWIGFFFLLFALHLASSYYFYIYAINKPVDANVYYFNNRNFDLSNIKTGAISITFFTQRLRELVNATFLDAFLLFQLFGLVGLVFLWRTMQELMGTQKLEFVAHPILLLLLPGLHFWTASIGKDSVVMLGSGLIIWSCIYLRTRFTAFLFGLLCVYFVRPHIAAMAVMAVVSAAVFTSSLKIHFKLSLLVLGSILLAVLLPTVQERFSIDELNLDAIADFVSARHEIGLRRSSSVDIVSLPLPLKMASLMFQPFFFDAEGLLAYIASVENLILLLIILYLLYRVGDVFAAAMSNFVVMFCILYSGSIIVGLSLVHYNIGLGLRQKIMALPGIIILYLSVRVWRKLRVQDKCRVAVQAQSANAVEITGQSA